MSEDKEMVFSACIEWFNDWIQDSPPTLRDEWDFAQWMEEEMREATDCFIQYAFTTARARNDAILILRALYYEYFLFRHDVHIKQSVGNPDAATRLLALPQTAQKSSSWHAEARELLTGHEFGAVCYGTAGRRNAVIAKKCCKEAPLVEEEIQSRHVFTTNEDGGLSALKWGWRYEPVARSVFEELVAKGSVNDSLGRIRHPSLPKLAASPDGLITSGSRCGRLVEIKCPVTRELTGTIPIDYYCQMQLQAEVCDVDAVEYIEIRFATFSAFEETAGAKAGVIGKVCVTAPTAETPADQYVYEYSPLFPRTEEGFASLTAWTPSNPTIHETSYWYVKDMFTKTVLRNVDWWENVGKPAYEEFWKDVEEARADGRFGPQAAFIDSDSAGTKTPPPAWVGEDE